VYRTARPQTKPPSPIVAFAKDRKRAGRRHKLRPFSKLFMSYINFTYIDFYFLHTYGKEVPIIPR
jgi:hypothetical protein